MIHDLAGATVASAIFIEQAIVLAKDRCGSCTGPKLAGWSAKRVDSALQSQVQAVVHSPAGLRVVAGSSPSGHVSRGGGLSDSALPDGSPAQPQGHVCWSGISTATRWCSRSSWWNPQAAG
jgi:hypothetical protein